ncbi:MAG: helix-hairpin-helix domain-containing protein [bacterium]
MKKIKLFPFLILLFTSQIHAETAAGNYLIYNRTVKSAGMGGLDVIFPDAANSFWGPAAVVFKERKVYSFDANKIGSNDYFTEIAASSRLFLPFKKVAVSLEYWMHAAEAEIFDYDGNSIEDITWWSHLFTSGFGMKLHNNFAMGLSFHNINEDLDNSSYGGSFANFGWLWKPGNFRLGMTMFNFAGSSMESYSSYDEGGNEIINGSVFGIGYQGRKLSIGFKGGEESGIGLEYKLNRGLILRAGMQETSEGDSIVTYGLTLRAGVLDIDFAGKEHPYLTEEGMNLQVGMSLRWGGVKEEKTPKGIKALGKVTNYNISKKTGKISLTLTTETEISAGDKVALFKKGKVYGEAKIEASIGKTKDGFCYDAVVADRVGRITPKAGDLVLSMEEADNLKSIPAKEVQREVEKVNINEAGVEELVAIPGLGRITAGRIIQDREKRGLYKKIEDLLNVPNFTRNQFEKIKDYITVGKVAVEPAKIEMIEVSEGEKINVAVTDFVARPPLSQSEAAFISDFVRADIVTAGRFNVVDKNNMDKVLAEQGFQQTGCSSAECAVQIGKILNVKMMIVGSCGQLLGKYIITLNVVSVESAKIVYSDDISVTDPDALRDNIKEMIEKFSRTVK